MSLKDDFKARFPEFDGQQVDAAFPGLESLWPCLYGATYEGNGTCDDNAILYLNAHLFTVEQSKGPAFTSSSKSVGSVSVTKLINDSMSAQDSFYNSTKYGQKFKLLTQFRQGACFV